MTPENSNRIESIRFLVLLDTGSLQVLILSRQNGGSAVDAAEGVGNDWRAVCTNGRANGHEEAVMLSQHWRRVQEVVHTQMWLQIRPCTVRVFGACHLARVHSEQCL